MFGGCLRKRVLQKRDRKRATEKGDRFIFLSCYQALGNTAGERAERCNEFEGGAIPARERELMREALQRGELTGNDRFMYQGEAIIGRRIENRKRGRPRKTEKESKK